MAKFEFKKDTKKNNSKKPRPVKKTNISNPQETYDPLKANQKVEEELKKNTEDITKRPVGRPKTGRKTYQTVRLLKSTVTKINALENALGIATQDETVDQALDRVINGLTSDEKRGYNLWLEMFKKKENKQ